MTNRPTVQVVAASTMLMAWLALGGCQGTILDEMSDPRSADGESPTTGTDFGDGTDPGAPSVAELEEVVPPSSARRLSREEYANTIEDLTGGDADLVHELIPIDVTSPEGLFDNEWELQVSSQALVAGAEQLAREVAAHVVSNRAENELLSVCAPTGPDDRGCFAKIVERLGRRALRRPMDEDELARFVSLSELSVEADDFYFGIEAAISALLQHPRFLYRVEVGEPVADAVGLYRLDDWEIASRLSYLIWQTTPDEWLLDLAAAGELSTSAQIEGAAREMLGHERAARMVTRYHAMWLGYDDLNVEPELREAMRTETDALVTRVIFEEHRPWQDLFLSEETFVSDVLAEHYGLEPPGSSEPAWTSYAGTDRRGILSHGSFLSTHGTDEPTTPIYRGLAVRSRLLCQEIVRPANVNVDQPREQPAGSCKADLLSVHEAGGCAGCHQLLDPIGFGFENYDLTGRYRTVEPDNPDCAIDGQGTVENPDLGSFEGPAGLAELLVGSKEFEECMVKELYRFATGRWELEDTDDALLEQVASASGSSPSFDEVLLRLVTHASFTHRRDP